MLKERERHARILCRIWDDDDWKARSPRAQWFYMLLLSQASLNRAGVIDLTSKRWARLASGPSVEQQISLAMEELAAADFIIVDHDTEELFVRSYMRWDGVAKQPNVLKAACRQALEVHSARIRAALVVELRKLDRSNADDAAELLSKGSGNPSPNPSPDGSPNGSSNGSSNPGGWGKGSSSSHLGNSSSSSSSSEIASRPADSPRPDVEALCSRLEKRVRGNGAKATVTKKWRNEARLLLDRDGRPFDESVKLIDWATSDSFWKSNILSMPTFRAKYDQLRLQAGRASPVNGYQSQTDANIAAFLGGGEPHLKALPGGAS